MATVTFGFPAEDIRGRVGGLIFQRWKQTRYVRRYTPPRASNTPKQMTCRSQLRALVAVWKGLGGDQAAWNKSAVGLPMSGYNLFLSRNMLRLKQGLPITLNFDAGDRSYPPRSRMDTSVSPSFPSRSRYTIASLRHQNTDLRRIIPDISLHWRS